jgi:4-amino-4-deoxy-L-arabinose transferase-like glycosyltransferase
MSRTGKLLSTLIFLLQALYFLYVSQHRLIDGDESFYFLASRLVMQHHVPYLDFFYTQAPLLPYVLGAWLKLTGMSWYAARSFCALLSTLIGMMIYQQVCRETGKWPARLYGDIIGKFAYDYHTD